MLKHIRIYDVTICKCFKSVLFSYTFIIFIIILIIFNEHKYVIGLHSVPCSYWSERLLKDSSHLDFVTKIVVSIHGV